MSGTNMIPRVFLEKNEDGEWFEEFVYNSRFQLQERGFEIIPFVGKVDRN
jgi:hypothetical protein